MTVTIDLPPEVEQAYRKLAAAQGVPLDRLVRDAVIAFTPAPNLGMTPADPDEWINEFKTWAISHTDLPLLSDEAISRDSIYAEACSNADSG